MAITLGVLPVVSGQTNVVAASVLLNSDSALANPLATLVQPLYFNQIYQTLNISPSQYQISQLTLNNVLNPFASSFSYQFAIRFTLNGTPVTTAQFVGPVGPQGNPGTAGHAGPIGPAGPPGPPGGTGMNVEQGGVGVVGNPFNTLNFTGVITASGSTNGVATINVASAAGPTGATGATGPAGHTGATGATGPAGAGGINVESGGTAIANNPHTTLNFTGSAVSAVDSGGGVATVSVTAPSGVGPVYPRGLANAGPASSFSPGTNVPVGTIFTAQAAGVANLVYDSTTFTRGASGYETTFGPFVWGVRAGGNDRFVISTGRSPSGSPPFPADVFRYDTLTGILDVIEVNDVGPEANLAGASPCQGNVVVDASGNAWTIEQTSNTLVKIQSEPPKVSNTLLIPNSAKNLLAYDSVNNAIVLLGIMTTGRMFGPPVPVLLATFNISTSTFSADVSITGTSYETLYQSLFYTPVSGALHGGYIFVGGSTPGGPSNTFDVFMLDPVTLATVASQTGLSGSHEYCPTGFTYLASSNKLFVSIGTNINRFTVGVGTLTWDTSFSPIESPFSVLAGMTTTTTVVPFQFPADIYYDGTTNLVWIADQEVQTLVGYNANTKTIAFSVDLSGLGWGEGANRVIGDGTNVYILSSFNSPIFAAVSQTTGAIVGYGQVSDSFAEDMVIGGTDQIFVVSSNGGGYNNNIELFSITAMLGASFISPATPTTTTPVTQSYSCITYDSTGPFVYAGTSGQTPSELINQLVPSTLIINNTLTYSASDFNIFQRLTVADGSIWASTNDNSIVRVNTATFPGGLPVDISLSGESFIESFGLSYDPIGNTILVGDYDNGAIYRVAASSNTQVSLLVPSPLTFESNAAIITYNATTPSIWAVAAFPSPLGSGPGYVGLFTTTIGSESQTATISAISLGSSLLWVTDIYEDAVYSVASPASTHSPVNSYYPSSPENGDVNSIVSLGSSFVVASDTLDELYTMSLSGSFTSTIDIAGSLTAVTPGAGGQVLTYQGPGLIPAWENAASPVPSPTVAGQVLTAIGSSPTATWATQSRDNGFSERQRRRNWLAQGAHPSGPINTVSLPTALSDQTYAPAGVATASIGTYVFVVGQTIAGSGALYGVDTLTGLAVSTGALYIFGDSPTTLIGYRGTAGNSAQDFIIAICPNTGSVTMLELSGTSPALSASLLWQTVLPGAVSGDNPSYAAVVAPSGYTGTGPTIIVTYYNASTPQLVVISGNGSPGTSVSFNGGSGIIGKPVFDNATGIAWVPDANSSPATIIGYQVTPSSETINSTPVASFTASPLSPSSGNTIYDTIFDGRYLWVLGEQGTDVSLVSYDLATATTGTPVPGPSSLTFLPISGFGSPPTSAFYPNLAFDGQLIYIQSNVTTGGVPSYPNLFAFDPDTGYLTYEYASASGTSGRSIVVLDSTAIAVPLFNGTTVTSIAIFGPTYENRNLNSLTLQQPLHNTTAIGRSLPVTSGPASPSIGQMTFVDLTGGIVVVDAPSLLQDGTWGVKDWKYRANPLGPYISISNPSSIIDDPNNPGTYTTNPIQITTMGQSVIWMCPDGLTWTVIKS